MTPRAVALRLAALVCAGLVRSQPSAEAKRRVDEAVAPLRRAIDLAPTSAEAYGALADEYERHRFLRAAGDALAASVALAPSAEGYRRLGIMLRRSGAPPDSAERAYRSALVLDPSNGDVYFNLGNMLTDGEAKLAAFGTAVSLRPDKLPAAINYAHALSRAGRHDETIALWRQWTRREPQVGARRLFDALAPYGRKLEAARVWADAFALNPAAPDHEVAQVADEWSELAAKLSAEPPGTRPAKCVATECVEGLDAALASAPSMPACAEADAASASPAELAAAMRAAVRNSVPLRMVGGGRGWGPNVRWTSAYLAGHAGASIADVMVVTPAHGFEVRETTIERPPRTRVRLADLVRLHTLRVELNLTLYARQSQLWLHPHLLADLAPTAAWMEELRVQDLNVWLGDGARPRPSLASPRRSCSRLM